MNSLLAGPVFIMVAAALWALDALVRTPLTQHIPSAAIVFYEHLLGLVILSPLFFKSFPILKTIKFKTWISILLLSLVSSIGGTVLFTQALGASFATGDFITPLLLLKIQPVLVIILSIVFLKEKISSAFYPFAVLAFIGSYLMSFGLSMPSFNFAGKELVVFLSLSAAFCWGAGTIISKNLLKRFSTRDATFLRFLAAIPVGFVVMFLLHQTYPPASLSNADLLRFTIITLSTGAVALLIYYFGLSRTKAHISTIAELVFPFTSIIIGITSLNPYGAPQTLSTPQIIGIALLLIAVIRISFLTMKKQQILASGPVVRGAGDGKKLGFPTANIALDSSLDLDYGVYACVITVDGKKHKAILHYGPRLVFGEEKPLFEVHIFDFKKTIYGTHVSVEIKDFIRKTMHFSSLKDMVQQIKLDCVEAKKILS